MLKNENVFSLKYILKAWPFSHISRRMTFLIAKIIVRENIFGPLVDDSDANAIKCAVQAILQR